jgi:hypothetical protein
MKIYSRTDQRTLRDRSTHSNVYSVIVFLETMQSLTIAVHRQLHTVICPATHAGAVSRKNTPSGQLTRLLEISTDPTGLFQLRTSAFVCAYESDCLKSIKCTLPCIYLWMCTYYVVVCTSVGAVLGSVVWCRRRRSLRPIPRVFTLYNLYLFYIYFICMYIYFIYVYLYASIFILYIYIYVYVYSPYTLTRSSRGLNCFS